jgi:hypothetical protein
MKHLSLTNWRAIKHAEIDLTKITAIVAPNEKGKTCTIQALQAATTGRVIPIDDVPKSLAHRFVHDGTQAAEIILKTDEGQSQILYPSCESTSTGKPLNISPVSAGTESLLDYDKKTRVAKLTEMLKAYPTKSEVQAAFLGISSEFVDAWETIDKMGWDTAHKNATMRRTSATGEWKQITGQAYGSKLAQDWRPVEYEADLDIASEDGLKQQIATDQNFLDVAKTDQGIAEAELSKMRLQAEQLPLIDKNLKEAEKKINSEKSSLVGLEKMLADLPLAEQPKGTACPHCGKMVVISSDKLIKLATVTEVELKKRLKNIADAKESIGNLKDVIKKSEADRNVIAVHKNMAIQAQNRISTLTKKTASAPSPERIEELRAKVERAKTRLLAWQKRRDSAAVQAGISTIQKTIDLLSPEGLRLVSLSAKLAGFNRTLASVCKAATWPITELIFDKDSISINYDARHYAFTSESAQFRARVSLQIATALFVGDVLVLIDRADILDSPGRTGLFRLLASTKIDAVLGMTLSKEQATKYSSTLSGMDGSVYWIEGGEVEKL